MGYRIGVDVGGTFTDFALLNESDGRLLTHKQLTTPHAPSEAFLEGVLLLVERAGIAVDAVDAIIHGTTLVTNAVIERKGVMTGMLVTEGFRDTVDMARECRYDLFDLRIAFPAPVVDRRRRFEVPERLSYAGETLRALDLEAIGPALADFIETSEIEALAICLLHSYVDDRHEQQLAAWVRRRFPQLHLSVSSELFPFMREYERWTTTCLNAYVQPTVDRYLARIEAELAGQGFHGRIYVMSSSGGTLTTDAARRFPIRMLESGPAAGALMSARHGATLGLPQILSFDMGGTTAKGCIIRDSKPLKAYDFEVARMHEFKRGSGLPVKIPVIDMIEIGAGGGSIANVDARGVLTVGPRSAGADPGPACYGRGGDQPTLTDANLILGYLDPASFLGGAMAIDRAAAEAVVHNALAAQLSSETTRIAWGVHEVINEDVARAFRIHASERGVDYRSCSMVAFGGSGPIHGLRIARKLKIPQVICPSGAGVMSAFGLLISPLSFEVVRSRRCALEALTPHELAVLFGELARGAAQPLLDAGVPKWEIRVLRRLDMRYQGQGYEIEVALPDVAMADGAQADPALCAALPALFDAAYKRVFSVSYADKPLEIINWKVEAVGPAPATTMLSTATKLAGTRRKGTRRAYFPEANGFVDVPVIDRYALVSADTIEGPALVEERESTCVIGVGDRVRVDAHGNLVASLGGNA